MDKKRKKTDILTLESTSKVSDNYNLTALVAPTANTNLNQCMYLFVMYLQTPNKTLYKPRYLRVTLVKRWRHLVVCMWKCFFGMGPSHLLRHQTSPGSPPDSKRHHGRVHRPTWVRNNCINQTHILFFELAHLCYWLWWRIVFLVSSHSCFYICVYTHEI